MTDREVAITSVEGYFFYPWAERMRSMLGKEVIVTISKEPLVEHKGILVMFSDEGDICIQDETGCQYYMWPNLETRLADESA